jgi:hypothetical protein
MSLNPKSLFPGFPQEKQINARSSFPDTQIQQIYEASSIRKGVEKIMKTI